MCDAETCIDCKGAKQCAEQAEMFTKVEQKEKSEQNVNKEVLTEVTTIAEQEAKSGQKIIPENLTQEELVKRASLSLMRSRKQLAEVFGRLSKKATIRLVLAAFDLPQEGLPVYLVNQDEKLGFALAQSCFSSKFILIQNAINNQLLEQKALKEKQQNEQKEQETAVAQQDQVPTSTEESTPQQDVQVTGN